MRLHKVYFDTKDRPILETVEEKKQWLRQPKLVYRNFLGVEEIVANTYNWVELPDKILVSGTLSCQLDIWLKEYKEWRT